VDVLPCLVLWHVCAGCQSSAAGGHFGLWSSRCWPVACPDASLLGGGMPCTRVASQLMCLMCSWLLPLACSFHSLSPLLGQCPGVAVETLLGDRSGSALQAPLSTSLDSVPSFLLLSSPPVPQGILASALRVDITGQLLLHALECCVILFCGT